MIVAPTLSPAPRFIELSPHEIEARRLERDVAALARGELVGRPGSILGCVEDFATSEGHRTPRRLGGGFPR